MTKDEILNNSKKESGKYTFLNKIIDWGSIENQLSKNINLFSTRNKEEPLNLIESLLQQKFDFATVFDCKTNLRLLNDSLSSIWNKLEEIDKSSISSKVSNLSNTCFWDTALELWLANQLDNNQYGIKLEYPLRPYRKGFTPPDADVAIVDKSNQPIWLIECCSPTLEIGYEDLVFSANEPPFMEPIKAINWILFNINKKFILKFEPHLREFPNTKIAVLISVIKADDISIHLSEQKLPIIISSKINCMHPNLSYAAALRYEDDIEKIKVVKLLEYKVF